ncbi:unnamed protein product [Caretta caretta]
MTKQIWRVWIFYMVITANRSEEKAMTQACPSCDGTHICDCSSMNLSTIPSGLTTDVTGLNLSYNSIEHVRETDLKLGVNLRVLLLQSNQIRTIDKESFIFLGKLEHLDLSDNKLTHLSPIWFRPLFSLQHLNIRGNLYTTLGENPLFSNLKNLRYLRLGNNHSFSAIRKQDFDGITVLEQLEIDGQRLKQYESGSLTTVNSINHTIMNINDVQVLSGMLEDLTNSAICVELRHIAFNTASESSLLEPMSRSVMEKLVFKNVLFTDASIIRVVNILRRAKQFLELEVDNSVLQGTGQWHEQIKVNRESAFKEGIANVLANWPENYICDSPSSVRGQQIKAARLSLFECHKTLAVSLICILVVLVILLIVILGYKLHVIWYMKMTWAWLQAKRKPKRAYNQDFCYDAFVSYSERDSEWVENLMVQELENAIPPFKLCLHKRDFVPGKWIIDNIIDSIEKSHKTLFVLSEHFVQSEWCKYELEFSHFRLFDENNDSAILILLEPIQEQTIPKRFCKLRKIMNTKTYLEWPLDENQQQIFWNNLKTALKSYDDF